ncbi:hypothetical protein [Lacrimispora sp.]|uniref:hypothetical protein n=1 Tax=Lacrimispora sp. TaxID=2719234 RepID=UPI0028AAD405|nr:hypothetical protein [Lacrimispora sp.]
MFHIEERELNTIVQSEYQRGVAYGIKLMEQKILHACEWGNSINIEGRAYFVKTDMENLRDIFLDLEKMNEGGYEI